MKEVEREVFYKSTKKKRGLFGLGREVKRAIDALDKNNGPISSKERTKFLRHESAHHIPLINKPVQVEAFRERRPDQVIEIGYIVIRHFGTTDQEDFVSSTYPLRDTKLWKMGSLLSSGDVKVALDALWNILKGAVRSKTKA